MGRTRDSFTAEHGWPKELDDIEPGPARTPRWLNQRNWVVAELVQTGVAEPKDGAGELDRVPGDLIAHECDPAVPRSLQAAALSASAAAALGAPAYADRLFHRIGPPGKAEAYGDPTGARNSILTLHVHVR